MKYDVATVSRTGITAGALALFVTLFAWSWVQSMTSWLITEEVKVVASVLSLVGFIGAMGYANFGIIPMNSKLRLSLYALGMGGLLVTLVPDKNTGNIFLEVFLIYLTLWSLVSGNNRLEKVNLRGKRFGQATFKILIFLGIGLLAAFFWPVGPGTEMQDWFWPWVALTGGAWISLSIFLLEMGFFKSMKKFAGFYCVGNIILAISYLGEFNFVGVVLNVSLGMLLLWVTFIDNDQSV